MKTVFLIPVLCLFFYFELSAQQAQKKDGGIIIGSVLDSATQKAMVGATVSIIPFKDSSKLSAFLTDKNGSFSFSNLEFGFYKLRITAVGYRTKLLDSIYLRTERSDFNLNELYLSNQSIQLSEVVIYAEKPLIESKEGNIIFNVGESALSNGSTATDLLKQTPLVTTDPNGKVLIRGKEPKILIDDKPVELNMQQLQDMLESMPGSTIEKIEVLTNPPPQYANEQGGVINIVTKKGRVGFSGRVSVYYGSRGETGVTSNFNYRKQGFAVNFTAGAGYNQYQSDGYSNRTNIYTDSTNQFKTNSSSQNKNIRPNFRLNVDYDLNKYNILNFVAAYNQNDFDNNGFTQYRNINRFDALCKMSERTIETDGYNRNPSFNFTYTRKGKVPGQSLRVIAGYHLEWNKNARNFFQQFFNPDETANGIDSLQKQSNKTNSSTYNLAVDYNKLLKNKKTSFSTGGAYTRNNSQVQLTTEFLKKPENSFYKVDLLSNHFKFHQEVISVRFSIKHIFKPGFSVSAGAAAEQTSVLFDLLRDANTSFSRYYNFLPFANINRSWKNGMNLTFAYRRTIRRPGIGEMNPAIDYGDPYNIRYGNPGLLPTQSHTFDLVSGITKTKYFFNAGFGYNIVEDVFSQIRTLQPDGKTVVTWDNVSNRKEYETSAWGGITISKKLRTNISASYIYNQYGTFDKVTRKYRDGGSFTSNFTGNYIATEMWTFTGAFTFNRFANPQGTVKSNINMNIGVQRRLFKKKFILTLNTVDPFFQQRNRVFTYGTNFNLESYSRTQTRNYRLTLSYNFNKTSIAKKKSPLMKPVAGSKKR